MSKNMENGKPVLRVFPRTRISVDYPWQIWIVGWLAIYKSLIWLTTSPLVSDQAIRILGYKYSLCLIPLLVFGIGIWNLRKWAMWGIIILSIAELLFFIVYPSALSSLVIDKSNPFILFVTLGVWIINGPISDIIILIASPFLLKHAGKYTLLDNGQPSDS